ncbi:hypothetical protein [Microbulbifer discodermiae]|uniref:hypothetical protein n=1 Tax=Microbulbifer sp. 2201CG32-9 TaxID=3232309 RepID=UPI00345B5006
MIIAKIGNYEYKLNILEDAENLLRILSSATEVESHFIARGLHYSSSDRPTEISVSVSPRELLSPQELQQLREEKQ